MPIVTVSYMMVVPGGHHRQPRNTGGVINLNLPPLPPTNEVPGSPAPAFYWPILPYPAGGSDGNAKLMFWSVIDGTNGQVFPAGPLNYVVGTSPLAITAWYFPISGPSTGQGGPMIIDDAFSAALGKFIDDTFVDVTSDPSLTSGANVVGEVPTNEAETLVAKGSVVSTPEPFQEWIVSWSSAPGTSPTLNVPRGEIGMAVAIYHDTRTRTIPPNITAYNPWWWIETWWGHGPDTGPEGVREFAVATELAAAAARASPRVRAQVVEAALQQAKIAASLMQKQLKSTRAR